jgi:hypothetical protein
MTKAPWTVKQVEALNAYQRSGWHPYTCGALDRKTGAHADYQALMGGDFDQLVATTQGWIYPVCGYTQDWADDVLFAIGQKRLTPMDVIPRPGR